MNNDSCVKYRAWDLPKDEAIKAIQAIIQHKLESVRISDDVTIGILITAGAMRYWHQQVTQAHEVALNPAKG